MGPEVGLGLVAGSLALIAVLVVAGAILFIIPYWKIFEKTGNSPALALLMLVPLANVILVYWLAFSEWPALRRQSMRMPSPPCGPLPPPPAAGAHCQLCGAQVDAQQRFCTSCGGAVNR